MNLCCTHRDFVGQCASPQDAFFTCELQGDIAVHLSSETWKCTVATVLRQQRTIKPKCKIHKSLIPATFQVSGYQPL